MALSLLDFGINDFGGYRDVLLPFGKFNPNP